MLNVTKDGKFNYNGAPYLWGAFIPKDSYKSLPRTVVARQLPEDATVELPSGAVVVASSGDYIEVDPSSFAVLAVVARAEFESIWDIGTKSVV